MASDNNNPPNDQDDDNMSVDGCSVLDENLINSTLLNLSNETFTGSSTIFNDVTNHEVSNKPNPKKRDSSHISDSNQPTQQKVPHVLNKSGPSEHAPLPNNSYSVHNKGPYFVVVEPKNPNVSKHPILIGKILHSAFPNSIKNISKNNFSRVNVECRDGASANKIVNSLSILEKYDLNAFIPNFRVSREGIIRDVPLEITIDDFIKNASTNLKCPILGGRRFITKKDNGVLSPTSTVYLRFDGQEVPEYLTLFHLRLKISPYVSQPKICYNCFRFGHVANQCKRPRCRFCGDPPHQSGSTCPKEKGPFSCLNCDGSHLVTDKTCPAYQDQILVRKIAAYRNTSIKDASNLYHREKKASQNSMSPLDVRLLLARSTSYSALQSSHPPAFNYSNFPNLGEVDLDSFEGTSTNLHAPSFANISKINKPKSPRKQLQTKAPTQSPNPKKRLNFNQTAPSRSLPPSPIKPSSFPRGKNYPSQSSAPSQFASNFSHSDNLSSSLTPSPSQILQPLAQLMSLMTQLLSQLNPLVSLLNLRASSLPSCASSTSTTLL